MITEKGIEILRNEQKGCFVSTRIQLSEFREIAIQAIKEVTGVDVTKSINLKHGVLYDIEIYLSEKGLTKKDIKDINDSKEFITVDADDDQDEDTGNATGVLKYIFGELERTPVIETVSYEVDSSDDYACWINIDIDDYTRLRKEAKLDSKYVGVGVIGGIINCVYITGTIEEATARLEELGDSFDPDTDDARIFNDKNEELECLFSEDVEE